MEALVLRASDATRPVRPREIHQGAHGRQKAGRGIFPALSERAVPDRGRELAPSAIAKYRIHHEAAARADRGRLVYAPHQSSALARPPFEARPSPASY